MAVFGKRPVSSADRDSATPNDARSDVWAELMAQHGHSSDACRHESRHTKLDHTVNLLSGSVELLAVATILDTALNVPVSGLNLYGTDLPVGGDGASEATTSIASGILGSIFAG